MFKFVALWNIKDGVSEAEFERWYAERHIGDARRIPGLVRYTVNRAAGGSEGGSRYYRMAELCFADEAAFERAFASAEWRHAFEDARGYIADHLRLKFDSRDVELDAGARS